MPGGVHGHRTDAHLTRLSKEDTFVSRLQGVIVPTDRDMRWKDLWEADMGVVMTEYFFKDDVDSAQDLLDQNTRNNVEDEDLF